MTLQKDSPALPPRALSPASRQEMTYSLYMELLPETISYADIFDPAFWRHHKNIAPYTMIRLRAVDGRFDVFVTVKTVVAGGVVVEFHSGRPPAGVNPYEVEKDALDEFMVQKVAPIHADGKPTIRTQFLPRTGWRLLGLGSEEVSRNMKTQAEADTAMATYLLQINMRQPTDEELKAHADAKLAASAPQPPKAPAPAAAAT